LSKARAWAKELAAGDGWEPIEDALETSGAIAVAAAEIVAAVAGFPGETLPKAARSYAAGRKGCAPELVERAHDAVERISADSDLRDAWEASDDGEEWEDAMNDLLRRTALLGALAALLGRAATDAPPPADGAGGDAGAPPAEGGHGGDGGIPFVPGEGGSAGGTTPGVVEWPTSLSCISSATA
jgi:hypothetical protein